MAEQPIDQIARQAQVDQLVDLVEAERRARVVAAPPPAAPARDRRVRTALAVTAPILVASLLIGFGEPLWAYFFEEQLTPAMAQEEARRTLTSLVADIELFRRDYNDLPETLYEIGVP